MAESQEYIQGNSTGEVLMRVVTITVILTAVTASGLKGYRYLKILDLEVVTKILSTAKG